MILNGVPAKVMKINPPITTLVPFALLVASSASAKVVIGQ